MSHNILITGASGYLGGSLLARFHSANLPPYNKLFALVRTPEQSLAVEQYGAEPLDINLQDEASITFAITSYQITIIYYLINAGGIEHQPPMIKALAEVKKETGQEVHFLHTSGAKLFSSHAGHPADRPLLDNEEGLYEIQKEAIPVHDVMQGGIDANNITIETAEAHGVRSYIFTPCIVYGQGEGFGNPISIQTVAIVKAARKLRRVYSVDDDYPSWPVCHVLDNTALYLEILRKILQGDEIGYGKHGHFLASSGLVRWIDIYRAMAKALGKRGVVYTDIVEHAGDAALEEMGKALGCPREYVGIQLGGKCTFEARHGSEIGWKALYPPEHILEAADEEVDLILKHI